MRKTILLPLLILLCTGCATALIVQETPPDRIVPLSHLYRLDVLTRLNAYVFVLEPGTSFPLDVTIDSDLVGLSDREKRFHIVVKRKLYARFRMPESLSPEDLRDLVGTEGNAPAREAKRQKFLKDFMVFLSMDAVRWAPVNDAGALKEMLGLRRVDVSVGLGMDLKEGIKANLLLKTLP